MFARLSLRGWFTEKAIFRGYVWKLLRLSSVWEMFQRHDRERAEEESGATLLHPLLRLTPKRGRVLTKWLSYHHVDARRLTQDTEVMDLGYWAQIYTLLFSVLLINQSINQLSQYWGLNLEPCMCLVNALSSSCTPNLFSDFVRHGSHWVAHTALSSPFSPGLSLKSCLSLWVAGMTDIAQAPLGPHF